MRIIDLQRRLREIGRIRIGERVPTRSGKSRPAKIDTFRLTSRDEQVIRAAADRWGGTPEPWPDGPGGGQWQVRTTTDQIPVVIPPGDMSFSQSYEVWSAGGCQVRCDGRWDHIADKACHCDPEDRDCKIHTRLSVILPDLPGLGVWRLETHGYYAAVELGGIVDICAAQSAQGVMLPARLRLEHREVKRVVDGKVQTRKFGVPVLDLDVHPLALAAGPTQTAGIAPPTAGELPAPRPALTPVPTSVQDGSMAPTVAEQVAAIDQPVAPPRRANAAQPIPSTGLKPRTAVEAAAHDTNEQPPPAPAPAGDAPTPAEIAKHARRVFAFDYEGAPHGKKTHVLDRLRRACAHAVTGGRTASTKECDPAELTKVATLLGDIEAGRITYDADPLDDTAGVTFRLASGRERTVLWADIETPPDQEDPS